MKSKTKIILRADADSSTGLGHLLRTCSLAAILHDDFDCLIASRPQNEDFQRFVNQVITDSGAQNFKIDFEGIPSLDKYNAEMLGRLQGDEIVVLDNYYFDNEFRQKIRQKCRSLVCIDDLPDRRYDCDAFFSPSPLEREMIDLPKDALFRAGPEWSFLRAPFIENIPLRSNSRIRSVLIAMGGTDPLRLTSKIAEITSIILPEADIRILAGPSMEISLPEDISVEVYRNLDAGQLVELMDASDLGIFSASGISIEALARRLPVAAGYYVDNQRLLYNKGVEMNLFAPLGDLRDSPDLIMDRLINIIDSYNTSEPMTIDFKSQKRKIINIFRQLDKR